MTSPSSKVDWLRRARRKNTPRYAMLSTVTIVAVVNSLDRVALGLALQDIKEELLLNDTQLGLMTGLVFALFYATLGLPIGRWADRGDRVLIISLSAMIAGVAVTISSFATSFGQILCARIAAAFGEAGIIPTSFSLLADRFDRPERPRAVAIFGLNGPIAVVIGFFAAGWLIQFHGWRLTFLLIGIAGIILGVVNWLLVIEPRKIASAASRSEAVAELEQPSWGSVIRYAWQNRSFRFLLICLSVMFFFLYGTLQWTPAFLVRSYGLSTGEVGTWLAALVGISGILGTLIGGEAATRLAANNEALQLRAAAIAIGLSAVLSGGAFASSDKYVTLALIGLSQLSLLMVNAPLFAMIQTLIPERMRAVAFALVYLFANLIGLGFGPLAVGALSDALANSAQADSLRFALLSLSPVFLLSAVFAWRASGTIAADVRAANL